jgi:hypothetical protein
MTGFIKIIKGAKRVLCEIALQSVIRDAVLLFEGAWRRNIFVNTGQMLL